MIYNSPEHNTNDSCTGADIDLLLFSDDDEDYDDDRSFFEIAIHHTQHKQQRSYDEDDNDDDDEEDRIELRISFSSGSASLVSSARLLPAKTNCNATRSISRDMLIIATHGSDHSGRHVSPFSSEFSSSSLFSSSSVDAASPDPPSSEQEATRLGSNWDLTPACCLRKSSEKTKTPAVNNNKGYGILNFLIKFPAALKFRKLLESFAKATPNTPTEQDIATINSKTTPSHVTRRRLHKFLKKSLNKWLVPISNELGLKNMKSYCSFDDDHHEMDHMIVITSNEKKVVKTKKRKGISNPSSIKSSPVHQAQINGRGDDHHQSSIQAAIAHCRRSSTPDFCFSTSHLQF